MTDFRFDMSAYVRKYRDPKMVDDTPPHVDMNPYSRDWRDPAARIDELLKANTGYLEEARAARRDTAKLQRALSQIVERIGITEIDKVMTEPTVIYGETITPAWRDVIVERRSQRLHHGYSADHDDKHKDREIPRSAASRLLRAIAEWNQALKPKLMTVAEAIKPWTESDSGYRPTLVTVVALLIAEIERYDRMLDGFDKEGMPYPPAQPTPQEPVITNTPRMSRCNRYLRHENKANALPRSCPECGLGPCKFPEQA